jgi:hypothetical protein
MSKLSWYWNRLRAMSPGEVALHARKRLRQMADARAVQDGSGLNVESSGPFPRLPGPADAPAGLRDALQGDAKAILSGHWKVFGHLDLQVDDPPNWHKDYLAGVDLATDASAFRLDHRELPRGADIKLIWELSRWHPLVRLAMAAYVLDDARAAAKCVEWLENWLRHNPPYRGWNWTSALEAGMRLVQFVWIDALLRAETTSAAKPGAESSTRTKLAEFRSQILPAHVRFTWRYRSFGSSANNHLIGELAGLILAVVRWPDLAKLAAPIETLQRLWEREVLAQFARDGGNREQALNYHLFSWEFCWQARAALAAFGRPIAVEVDDRLRRAAQFFVDLQVPEEPWDYGDSDSAIVTPWAADASRAVAEWHRWLAGTERSGAMEFWWGAVRRDFGSLCPDGSEWKVAGELPNQRRVAKPSGRGPELLVRARGKWLSYEESRMRVTGDRDWFLRFDCSPLGYLAPAAHGHLDALHLSIWFKGVALVVDPGTGAYYADRRVRSWLASRSAHNSPCALGVPEWPERGGPFLWASHHSPPQGFEAEDGSGGGKLFLNGPNREGNAVFNRTINPQPGRWTVQDREGGRRSFSVRWQLAPDSRVQNLGDRNFRVSRRGVAIEVQLSADWKEVFCVTDPGQVAGVEPEAPLAGTVSSAFRRVTWAPYLKLIAPPQGDKPCVFRTTFLACRGS